MFLGGSIVAILWTVELRVFLFFFVSVVAYFGSTILDFERAVGAIKED